MKAGGRQQGFTIVETMIVLAVSSVLAVSAMLLINGRQNKTQFQVAINGEKQAVEQIINETTNGFYPHATAFTCTGNAGVKRPTFAAGGSVDQGSNKNCVFMGKVLTYGVAQGGADASTVTVYPLIGNQFATGGAQPVNFAQAFPAVLGGPDNVSPPEYLPDLSTQSTLENGLTIDHTTYYYANGTSQQPLAKLGVLVFGYSLGQYKSAADGLNSAAQNLDLYSYQKSDVTNFAPSSTLAMANTLNKTSSIDENAQDVITKVELCFASGTTNQSGLITVSGKGQLGVTLTIMDGKTC